MRPDPGAETLVKLPGLLKSIGDFTQLAQYANGFVVAGTRTARHCQIDLVPVLVLVIVDLLADDADGPVAPARASRAPVGLSMALLSASSVA